MDEPTTSKYGYGWIRDLPDHRDQLFGVTAPIKELPASVDLRKSCPPVYDQGQLGSCTANAIGAAIDFEREKQGLSLLTPSRLFIYYNERVMEHSVASDSGAQIRDGIKTVVKSGAPAESVWPYEIANFTERPPKAAYDAAKLDRAVSYGRVAQTPNQLKGTLAAGYPVVFGFSVYESFESAAVAKSGDAPMPGSSEKLLGGHAVLMVGYDEGTQRFLVRNSWGTGWGKNGYFTLPYAYATDSSLASDFWSIRLISS